MLREALGRNLNLPLLVPPTVIDRLFGGHKPRPLSTEDPFHNCFSQEPELALWTSS